MEKKMEIKEEGKGECCEGGSGGKSGCGCSSCCGGRRGKFWCGLIAGLLIAAAICGAYCMGKCQGGSCGHKMKMDGYHGQMYEAPEVPAPAKK